VHALVIYPQKEANCSICLGKVAANHLPERIVVDLILTMCNKALHSNYIPPRHVQAGGAQVPETDDGQAHPAQRFS
jgi:hypothetical protein